jgi:hypothetical protein
MINCRQAAREGGMLGKKADLKAARRRGARKAVAGLLGARSPHSIMSFLSVGSILSAGSILSIASAGSVLSIGSVGSILSIGSSGSILSIGSAGSILGLGSAGYSPSRESDDQEES